jgi:hypothetical protein
LSSSGRLRSIRHPSTSAHFLSTHISKLIVKTFSDVTRTQKETAGVLFISLSFILLLVASWTIPSISRNSLLREPLFYVGAVVFGLLGFLALEIMASLSFLGDGARFGAYGFIIMLVIGAWIGGEYMTIFLSASIVGLTLFYLKSIFAIYRILSIETVQAGATLTVTEMAKEGNLNHFMIEGVGANFELLYYILDEFRRDSNVMFYARNNPPGFERLDLMLGDTMRFYSNHMLPLHRVDSKRTSRIIKQMCFECTTPEIVERGLINYWLRAHLNGGYTCVLVPYESDFLEKASACEGNYGDDLDIARIMNGADWLLTTDSLVGGTQNYQEVYTVWEMDEFVDKLSRVHPVT